MATPAVKNAADGDNATIAASLERLSGDLKSSLCALLMGALRCQT